MSKGMYLLAASVILSFAPFANATEFFIFPLKELEGVSEKVRPEARPLIDSRVRSLLTPEIQITLLGHFSRNVAAAYPKSVINAAQVRDVRRGAYQHLDDDAIACGSGFSAPLRSTYAATLGITRASWYEVERSGGRIEVLIPITLNLQLVKPDAAKSVFAISETIYTPFSFTKDEMGSPAMHLKISESLASTLEQQASSLVQQLRASFQPKEIPARIVGRSDGVWVADQGYEIGFKSGDEPLATDTKSGKEALFKVLNAESGYAVLRLLEGNITAGDQLRFTFESQADDSRKPRVIPVTSQRPDQAWTQSVTDIFAKEIGFRANFQVTPIDINFHDTMESITRQARCVPWDKFPSSKTVFNSRDDHPQYLIKFDVSRSPTARSSGLGDVKTMDEFITAITGQLIDTNGRVVHSDIATDHYRLERTAGQGLALDNAREISLKNATVHLVRRFVDNARFVSNEYKVTRTDKTGLIATGLSLPSGSPAPSFDVLRPLKVQVNGKPTYWRLNLGEGSEGVTLASDGTRLSYSLLDEAPRAGDIVRVHGEVASASETLTECGEPFRGTGSMEMDSLLPLIRHAAYRSDKHSINVANGAFLSDANRLFEAGFFKFRLKPVDATNICLRPGYSVKSESQSCPDNKCNAKILAAATIILQKGAERVANYVQAEHVSFDGHIESEGTNFIGIKAFDSVQKNLGKLTNKLNSGN